MNSELVSTLDLKRHIFIVRNRQVMLDSTLAGLYKVSTKVLNQAIKRNIERFPKDFMFKLTESEFENLKSQFVTSSHGGRRTLPNVFTEHGIAMLSSVLNSSTAIQINISIIREFIKFRELLNSNSLLYDKIAEIEEKYLMNRKDIQTIYKIIANFIKNETIENKNMIGFRID